MKKKHSLQISVLFIYMLFACILLKGQGTQNYITGQEGPSGGPGGQFCDTYTKYAGLRVKSISVRWGNFIDGITLGYDGGKEEPRPIVCGGPGGNNAKTITFGPGEYIVRVLGKYSTYVEYIYVQTSGGPSGAGYYDFGNKNSSAPGYFDYQAPQGMKIGNFITRSGTYLDAIGVILQMQ